METNPDQIKTYFEGLAKIRSNSLNDLQKSSFRDTQAIFIFELLQNADNAQATDASFELYEDRLIFRHNGKKHFTISNPANEIEDLKKNKLGDVNAIASIANFNQIEPKIGRFGFGIKSVYQYTSTLLIYDNNFSFQIEKYIIPRLLTEDYDGRKNDETIFVIPFNSPSKLSTIAYNEITRTLKTIKCPNLFLKTLNLISYKIENHIQGKFERKIELEMNYADIKVEFTNFLSQVGDVQAIQRYWIFSRLVNTYPISIAVLVGEDGYLKPLPKSFAYCSFETKEMTNLNYLINAPFLLTGQTINIKPNEPHNQSMISEIANLSAKSLMIFKEIGHNYDVQLINDSVLSIYPSVLSNNNSKNAISFQPIFDEVQKVFLSEEIIPTENGFTSKKNAYWTPDRAILKLFDNQQLKLLVKNPNARWVFRSINGAGIIQYIRTIVQNVIFDYTLFNSNTPYFGQSTSNSSKPTKPLPDFKDCFIPNFGKSSDESANNVDEKQDSQSSSDLNISIPFSMTENYERPPASIFRLNANSKTSAKDTPRAVQGWGANSNSFTATNSQWGLSASNNSWGSNTPFAKPNGNDPNFNGITAEFTEKQTFEWLTKFYKWISSNDSRIMLAKKIPIFLDKNKKAVSAFNPQNNNLQLFFPFSSGKEPNFSEVHPILFKNEENIIFMRKIGISVPVYIKNCIYNFVLPSLNSSASFDYADFFKKILFYFEFCSYEERPAFIQELRNTPLILYYTKSDKRIQRGTPDTIYYPIKSIVDYFEANPETRFICIEKYNEMLVKKPDLRIKQFLLFLGVKNYISIIEVKFDLQEFRKFGMEPPNYTQYINFSEFRIEGFDVIWDLIQKDHSKSIILWNVLLNFSKNNLLNKFQTCTCNYFYQHDQKMTFQSLFRLKLINEKWLINSNNELVAPNEIFLVELPKEFNIDDPAVPALVDFLNIKKRKVELLTSEYVNDHEFVERIRKAGLLEKFTKELEEKESESKK